MSTLRDLPSVDRLIQTIKRQTGESVPHERILAVARVEIDVARAQLRSAGAHAVAPSLDELATRSLARLADLTTPSLRPVINASGVIIQTNLGRAPLSAAALAAMCAVGEGYSNLEYDLERGERGSRHVHLTRQLCALTGAEDALVVNNNAAAIYLCLIGLAAEREVIVSRGQAVEIGGGFRIPDVLKQSGAQLVEVGTTNRTYARDYAAAITERTALLMRIHTSNFRLVGFVHETGLHELAQVGRAKGIPVLDDLGSGTLLPTLPYGLAAEPTVQESVNAGADLVCFSGDKLLGGPQAGLIVGRRDLIERLRKHPLARALRVDKTTIAGMAATLMSYVRGRALEEIPVWRMISTPLEVLRPRAERMATQLRNAEIMADVITCQSAVGGGSLPGETLPSLGLAISVAGGGLDALSQQLRSGAPAVVGRIEAERMILDLRTVLPEQDGALAERVIAAMRRVREGKR